MAVGGPQRETSTAPLRTVSETECGWQETLRNALRMQLIQEVFNTPGAIDIQVCSLNGMVHSTMTQPLSATCTRRLFFAVLRKAVVFIAH